MQEREAEEGCQDGQSSRHVGSVLRLVTTKEFLSGLQNLPYSLESNAFEWSVF